MLKKIILLLPIIFCSCSEKTMHNIGQHYLPQRAFSSFHKELANASPDFQRGWADGCEVGTANGSVNTFYQMFYRSNAVDGYAKANNADYRTGWGDAFWYCVRFEYIKQKSSVWGSMFGGYR